jgi:ABC-type glycerol-3-phosphate transport system substrate-binding protein
MEKIKKLLALGISAMMVMGLTACGASTATEASSNDNSDSTITESDSENSLYNVGETRTIKVGVWTDHFYDSNSVDIYDDYSISNEEEAQIRFDVVKEIEEKYNIRLEFVNLTYAGVYESVNTSIPAGNPDCDIYEVDLKFGIPAALNMFAVNLNDILPEDSDIFTDHMVFTPVDTGLNDGVYLFQSTSAQMNLENTYMLAYNKQMLDEAGLENPNDLYERGEWTWDKWREYLEVLTKDTDGDGETDVYGYGGRFDFLLNNLLMSNGTGIAMGPTETLSSDEVNEVLDFIYNIYNVDKTARPWNTTEFEDNQNAYVNGDVAFFIDAAWVSSENNDADLDFDVVWCPWPIGPSGDEETNKLKNVSSGNAWMIPSGVEDPELVYNVFYDWQNWYHGDTTLRDGDMTWWQSCAVTEENFEVMEYIGSKGSFDLWDSLGLDWDYTLLLKGDITASEFQDKYKQSVQDALDSFYR